MLMIISLIFCTRDIFFSCVYFVVNIVYFVVHIVCEVDVIANSQVLYLLLLLCIYYAPYIRVKNLLGGADKHSVQNRNNYNFVRL